MVRHLHQALPDDNQELEMELIAAGLAVGLSGIGAGVGLGMIGYAIAVGTARNPEASQKILMGGLVIAAFAEAIGIYGFITAMLIILGR